MCLAFLLTVFVLVSIQVSAVKINGRDWATLRLLVGVVIVCCCCFFIVVIVVQFFVSFFFSFFFFFFLQNLNTMIDEWWLLRSCLNWAATRRPTIALCHFRSRRHLNATIQRLSNAESRTALLLRFALHAARCVAVCRLHSLVLLRSHISIWHTTICLAHNYQFCQRN